MRHGTKYFVHILSDLTPQMHSVGEILCFTKEESETGRKITALLVTQLRSLHGGQGFNSGTERAANLFLSLSPFTVFLYPLL